MAPYLKCTNHTVLHWTCCNKTWHNIQCTKQLPNSTLFSLHSVCCIRHLLYYILNTAPYMVDPLLCTLQSESNTLYPNHCNPTASSNVYIQHGVPCNRLQVTAPYSTYHTIVQLHPTYYNHIPKLDHTQLRCCPSDVFCIKQILWLTLALCMHKSLLNMAPCVLFTSNFNIYHFKQ